MDCLKKRKVGIIGAGPAGMMSAVFSARNGAEVFLFEKNKTVGKKLSITGKGRCNVTNDCDNESFLKNVISNPRFLFSSINCFGTKDTKEFFENEGVPLKTERGNRVFPVSDKAGDIVDSLRRKVIGEGCKIVHEKVNGITVENGKITGLKTQDGNYSFDAVIICTGGKSYPLTGSDGDGYSFANQAGIKVTELSPSLVPVETVEDVSSIMGLSLKNVVLKVKDISSGKTVYEEMGEMLFTHYGVSGPLVLSASCHMKDLSKNKYKLIIDLKPALSESVLDRRIIEDFAKQKNKDFNNSLSMLLPAKIIPYIVEKSSIRPDEKVNGITKEQRKCLVGLLKNLEFTAKRFRPISEAIVTRGGIDVSEINPSTMESRKIKGLYFAGEVIDVDAYTGGFNLQIAFSTGAVAGTHSAFEN